MDDFPAERGQEQAMERIVASRLEGWLSQGRLFLLTCGNQLDSMSACDA
jgi:hypothetical protein